MKIGDYVRTNNGLIFKIVEGNDDNWSLDIEYSKLEYMEDTWLELYKYNDNGGWFIRENCKSSPNIIDLIQVGDYVNGLKVQEVNNEIKGFGTIVFDKDTSIMEDYIYSIVTKEQFSSMEYKIGDKNE